MPDQGNDNDQYKGPASLASSMGQAAVEGGVGLVGGGAAGALAGSLVKESTAENIKLRALEGHSHRLESVAARIMNESDDKKLDRLFEVQRGIERQVEQIEKATPRAATVGAFAFIGAIALGAILAAHGLFKGAQKGAEGKAQYDALKGQVADLQGRKELTAAINGAGGPARA